MSAVPTYPRADAAARNVDPMMLAQALDHIAKSAARSKSQTRRIRWIEQRALFALQGREYRDIDVDLPKDAGPDTIEKLRRKAGHSMRMQRNVIAKAEALLNQLDYIGMTREEEPLMAALREAIDMAKNSQDLPA